MELRGLEPLTPTLPVWCATSCAIAPRVVLTEVTPQRHPPQNRCSRTLAADLGAQCPQRRVLGRGTARKTKAGTAATIEQVGRLREECSRAGVRLVEHPAGVVKPWATDDRLRAYGCYVTGNHHRDAVRHALYAAVRAGYLPRRPAPRQ